ncbi:MAG TPA: hypothetical protein VGG61_14935 [Gemmataceae bacterium]|jgi:hypothetical protein
MMRAIVRGFVDGAVVFEDRVEIDPENDGNYDTLYALAAKHAAEIGNQPHMIEFEFLDEPDPLERFFRFGTDPRGMVVPLAIAL